MSLPDLFAYQRFDDGTTVTIIATSLTFTQDLIDPTRDTVIYADQLNLDPGVGTAAKPFNFPGHNLTIYARLFSGNSNGFTSISTQPNAPILPAPPGKLRTSSDPNVNHGDPDGQDADPIEKKDFGQNAGSITIVVGQLVPSPGPLILNSSGGQGRDGQDGGDAGNGVQGAPGSDDQPQGPQGTPGQNGSRGGNGGNGGRPGDGGNAGTITVQTVVAFDQSKLLTLASEGGDTGAPGRPGRGGVGGAGGAGGHFGQFYDEGGFEIWGLVPWPTYPDGNRGPNGHDGQVITGTKGSPAEPNIKPIGDLGDMFVADDKLFAQFQLSMQYAKICYLNKQWDIAKGVFIWVYGLTQATTQNTTSAKWDGLHKQARVLLSRLSRGLDYFGNVANWVPLASFALYSATLTDMFTLGGQIENVYTVYTQYLADQTKGYADFQTAFDAAQAAINQYQTMRGDTVTTRTQLWDECLSLMDQVDAQKAVMLNAEQSFKDAVSRKAKCMVFNDIVNVVAAVITCGEDVKADITAIGDVANTALDTDVSLKTGDIPTGFLSLCNKISTIEKDFSNLKDQWDGLQGAISPETPDGGKLVSALDDFDNQMAPYMDMPEAAAYKEAVHQFAALCQTRNMKILQCSKLDEVILELEGKIIQTQTQKDELQAQEAASLDPSLAPYRNFVLGLYQDFKNNALDQLYYENLAYRYRCLEDFPIVMSNTTMADLDSAHTQMLQAIIDYENRSVLIEQPFADLEFDLPNETTPPTEMQNFIKTGSITFKVPLDAAIFSGLTHIRGMNFSVSIPGAKTTALNNKRYILLQCHGDPTLVDPSGKQFTFTHNAVTCLYEYDIIKNGQGQDEDHYLAGGALTDMGDGAGMTFDESKSIALSPFSTWTLSLPAEYNPGLDLTNVQGLSIFWSGKATPAAHRKATVRPGHPAKHARRHRHSDWMYSHL